MDKDYYKILGINESDTADEIKAAYRKLARTWHPDVAGNTSDVLKRFKEINEAYEILSDKAKKAEYDKAKKFYDYARKSSTTPSSDNIRNNNQNSTKKKYTSNQYFKNINLNWEDLFGSKNKQKTEYKSK